MCKKVCAVQENVQKYSLDSVSCGANRMQYLCKHRKKKLGLYPKSNLPKPVLVS